MEVKLKKYAYFTIGAIIMVIFSGCSGMKFQRYDSKDELISVSMDYPSDWGYSEDRGSYNSYAQALFLPPKEKGRVPKALIAITVRNNSKIDFKPVTADAAAKSFLAKRMLLKDMKILSESKKELLGVKAFFTEISYLKPENLLNIRSKLILCREKAVIFKKGDNFYFLRYENSEEKFDEYSKAFDHMIKSLRLKNRV